MSIRTLVTRGYGSFGSIAEVVTRGYVPGVVVPPAHEGVLTITDTDILQNPVNCVLAGEQRMSTRKLSRALMKKIFRE